MRKNPLADQWIKKGDEDFYFASKHLQDEELFFAPICFHFHQAAEKYLKSYIVFYNLPFRRIHNLKELLQICRRKDKDFSEIEEECLYLNQFYVETRYPVYWPCSYSRNEAERARKAAEKIRKFVLRKIKK